MKIVREVKVQAFGLFPFLYPATGQNKTGTHFKVSWIIIVVADPEGIISLGKRIGDQDPRMLILGSHFSVVGIVDQSFARIFKNIAIEPAEINLAFLVFIDIINRHGGLFAFQGEGRDPVAVIQGRPPVGSDQQIAGPVFGHLVHFVTGQPFVHGKMFQEQLLTNNIRHPENDQEENQASQQKEMKGGAEMRHQANIERLVINSVDYSTRQSNTG